MPAINKKYIASSIGTIGVHAEGGYGIPFITQGGPPLPPPGG